MGHDKHYFLILKEEAILHSCFLSLRSTDYCFIAVKRPCLILTIEAKFYQFNWGQINIYSSKNHKESILICVHAMILDYHGTIKVFLCDFNWFWLYQTIFFFWIVEPEANIVTPWWTDVHDLIRMLNEVYWRMPLCHLSLLVGSNRGLLTPYV